MVQTILNVLLVLLIIAAVVLAVLYFLGNKLQKRQAEQQQMLTAFRISTQMEYSFWEMAYHLEKWPEGSRNNDAKSR